MTALATTDRDRLAQLEAVVERGLETFIDVGNALGEIRDRKLYRETHGTFENYIKRRWGFSRSRGYRLIEAAEVAGALSPIGDIPANEAQARELGPLWREDQRQGVELWANLCAEHGERLTAEKVQLAVRERMGRDRTLETLLGSSTGYEWYTPAVYSDAAREVLGAIDLDPASCTEANATVGATRYFDISEDGLTRPWHGRVFLNPPYARSLTGAWVAKAVAEYQAGRVSAAVLLLNAYGFDADWYRPLWQHASLFCFTDHRIHFRSPNGAKGGGSAFGSVFAYLGAERQRFADVFTQFGVILTQAREAAA